MRVYRVALMSQKRRDPPVHNNSGKHSFALLKIGNVLGLTADFYCRATERPLLKMRQRLKHSQAWFLLVTMLVGAAPALSDEIRIAVRANKGSEEAMRKWQATADYLNQAIPQHHFSITPFENNSALNQAISKDGYSLSITNPASAVELKIRYGHQPLATLLNKRQGKGYPHFGTVIFTRADRHDISSLSDLKGKVYMGVEELGFGGWRIAWGELQKNNIDPYHDFKELRFGGGNQKSVVTAVLHGEVDAGSVRTDLLEKMSRDGEITLSDIKVLGAKQVPGFPFLLSSDLYPEWPFSASHAASSELKTAVTRALLSIQEGDPAAIQGNYVGWTSPADYAQVETLLKELKVAPFRITKAELPWAFFKEYSFALLAVLLALAGLLLAFFYTTRLNRRFSQTQAALKTEIDNRERAEQALTALAQKSLDFSTEKQFFHLCITELAQLFSAKYAFIGLFSDADKTGIKTYVVWAGDRFVDNFEYPLLGTPCQDVLNLDVELISDHAAEKYPTDALLSKMGVESYFGAPLISSDGEMMGLVSVMDTKPMHPENHFRSVLKIFANRIALEIQRKREAEALQGMAEQLSFQASHDVLTGLVNRREFEVRLKNALNSAKNQHKQHSLCFLDLDQFKIINDACGHHAGDELLKLISATLSSIVRGSDTLARVGGDEFSVLLLDCTLYRARTIAEKLVDAVKCLHFEWEGKTFEVGVSIGITPVNSTSNDIYEVFKAADAACYLAKNLGNNRIHINGWQQAE